jgi:hypothetical protein
MCLKYPCTKNGTSALSLLGNFEILYPVVIEEVADYHFSLSFTVGVRFIRKTDIYPGVKKGR